MNHIENKNARLAHIAYLYYHEQMNQQDIAEETGVTRTLVSRMLNEAREKGIVSVCVKYPWRSIELENQLKLLTGLDDAHVIVSDPKETNESLQKNLGLSAAAYFDRHIKDGDTIGLSWGTALHHMVKQIHAENFSNSMVVQLIGATGSEAQPLDGPMLARMLSNRLGCGYYPLHAPLMVETVAVRESLIHDRTLQSTLQKAETADYAWVGIGSPLQGGYSLLREGYLSPQDIEFLIKEGVVGDVCAQLYNIQGKVLDDLHINQRTVGITLPALSHVKHVIGVSGGEGKKKAVLGAVRGAHINVLITDSTVAEYVIQAYTKQKK